MLIYRFGEFQLEVEARRLTKAGANVRLEPKTFGVLLLLVEKRGTVVTRDEFLERAWPDTSVEEQGVDVRMAALRKVLGKDAIATIRGSEATDGGYRFDLPVDVTPTQPTISTEGGGGGSAEEPPEPAVTGAGAESGVTLSRSRRPLWAIAAMILLGAASGVLLLDRVRGTAPSFDLTSADPRARSGPFVMVPWVQYGGDFDNAWGNSDLLTRRDEIDAWLARLAASGVRGVGWFLLADARAGIDFDNDGMPLGLTERFWSNYTVATELLAKHRLKVVWIVVDYQIASERQLDGTVQKFGRANLIEDPRHRAGLVANVFRPLAERMADDDTVAGIVPINEPENILRKGLVSHEAFRAFVSEVTGALKAAAPRLPVGTAHRDLESLFALGPEADASFYLLHHYRADLLPPAPGALVARVLNGTDAAKPLYLGEFNINHPPGGSLEGLVHMTRGEGYDGVWPWSLINRADVTGDHAEDVAPQFDLVETYARAARDAAERTATAAEVAFSSESWAARRDDLEDRARAAEEAIPYRKAQFDENDGWHNEVLRRLGPLRAQHGLASTDRGRARADVVKNEDWVARAIADVAKNEAALAAAKANKDAPEIARLTRQLAADKLEAAKASAALKTSTGWESDVTRGLAEIEKNILTEEANLTAASTGSRLHGYFLHEATVTADALRRLAAEMTRVGPGAGVR